MSKPVDPVAATTTTTTINETENNRKRKTPDDPRVKVAEFQEAMDSVLETTLRLMEEHDIPDDWVEFDPCDENGGMLWRWNRPKGRYRLWVFAGARQATVEDDHGDGVELVSVPKAIRRLKRMMDDDEEEEEED